MKIASFLFLLAFTAHGRLHAQPGVSAADKEAAYHRTVTTRAEKIVATLHLSDEAKTAGVTTLVANQYKALNAVYESRDQQLKAAKETTTDKEALAARTKQIEEGVAKQVDVLHTSFLSTLATLLTEAQITQIKDGMTYNVLSVTYTAMLDMIPALKPNEKEQIMAWLVEAREHAMDAESSDKKHWWFAKYKGRINNYLAQQGYDLQKERKDWELRLKARDEQKKQVQIQ